MQSSLKTKVVPIQRAMPTKRVPESQWFSTIQHEASRRMRAGVKIKDMAKATGLCNSTVSKIIYGETKRPTHRTVVLMMHYLGFNLIAER